MVATTEWMRAQEAAQELRRSPKDAKRILKLHGVPIVEHSQRDWEVRRSLVEGFRDRLEREAAAKIQNEGAQRDWLAPQTRRRPKVS